MRPCVSSSTRKPWRQLLPSRPKGSRSHPNSKSEEESHPVAKATRRARDRGAQLLHAVRHLTQWRAAKQGNKNPKYSFQPDAGGENLRHLSVRVVISATPTVPHRSLLGEACEHTLS